MTDGQNHSALRLQLVFRECGNAARPVARRWSDRGLRGDPESRHGIILAKNEKAKAFGVQTAETIWQAKRNARIYGW